MSNTNNTGAAKFYISTPTYVGSARKPVVDSDGGIIYFASPQAAQASAEYAAQCEPRVEAFAGRWS